MNPHFRYLRLLCRDSVLPLVLMLSLVGSHARTLGQALPGKIAFIRQNKELHLINPDGTGDALVWTDPHPELGGVGQPAFRPDGREIAFVSLFEAGGSYYDSNIYGIQPDGAGLRRITAPPLLNALAGYPKGSVTVEIVNRGPKTDFVLTVEGRTDGIPIILASGMMGTFTVPDIADLGDNVPQAVVVIHAYRRWINPALILDVKAGQTVTANERIEITGEGISLGVSSPSWRGDGSTLAVISGSGAPFYITSEPSLLQHAELLTDPGSVTASSVVWSPKEDLFAYGDALLHGLYVFRNEDPVRPELLVNQENNYYSGVAWLPDGSGLVYSLISSILDNSNLYLYDFASGSHRALTSFENEFAADPSVSPDGKYVAYSRSANRKTGYNVWVAALDGSQEWKVADDGSMPSWGIPSSGEPGAESITIVDLAYTPKALALTWSSVPGKNYEIEFSQKLAPASWRSLGTQAAAPAPATTTRFSDAAAVTANLTGFYRIRLKAQ